MAVFGGKKFISCVALALSVGVSGYLAAGCVKRSYNSGKVKTLEGEALTRQNGLNIPSKTLVLTFDDGPGAHTAELAAFLKSEGIRATFFPTANILEQYPSDGDAIVKNGHTIGNHSYSHPVPFVQGQAMVDEILAADKVISKYVKNGTYFFRAPGGAFDASDARVTDIPELKKYVGPFFWDIGGELTASHSADWACWANNVSVSECADGYMNEIHDRGSGIVLMHDIHDKSVDMFINYVYPRLKSEGYQFVNLDEVPDVADRVKQFGGSAPGTSGPTSPGSDGGGRTTCVESNATHRICAAAPFTVFDKGGARLSDANPWEPVCVTGDKGSNGSTGLFFVRPPAGAGCVAAADLGKVCGCDLPQLQVCLKSNGGEEPCAKKWCK